MADEEAPSTVTAEVATGSGEPVATEAPSHTLTDLGQELRFFTTALLVTHGGFDRDVLFTYNALKPHADPDMRPIAADLEQPIFQNLGLARLGNGPVVNWDHRLYMLHQSRFEELSRFLCAITIKHTARQELLRITAHVLMVVDVTKLSGIVTGELPMIPVTVFGLSTNRRFVHMVPADNPPITRARPRTLPPRQEMIQEARFFFRKKE